MTLSYENYLQKVINNRLPHDSISSVNKNSLIIVKKMQTLEAFYVIGANKGKLILLNLNKLPNFEKNFVLNFLNSEESVSDINFIAFLKRNAVKKAIQHNDPQKIKHFWMIPQAFNKEIK